MRILEKHPVTVFGHYLVVEGNVETAERRVASFCWVEDESGNMVSEFVDRDLAMGIAESLAGESGRSVDDVDDDEDTPRRGWIQ